MADLSSRELVTPIQIVGKRMLYLVDEAYRLGYEKGRRDAIESACRSQLDWDMLHG
jgi:hypothetical protein